MDLPSCDIYRKPVVISRRILQHKLAVFIEYLPTKISVMCHLHFGGIPTKACFPVFCDTLSRPLSNDLSPQTYIHQANGLTFLRNLATHFVDISLHILLTFARSFWVVWI